MQASKAGILEIADVFVVNKADNKGVESTVQDLEQSIALGRFTGAKVGGAGHGAAVGLNKAAEAKAGEWLPPILKTIADQGEGIDALMKACLDHQRFLDDTDRGTELRKIRRASEFRSILEQALIEEFDRNQEALINEWLARVVSAEADPYSAAEAVASTLSKRSTT